MGITMNIEHEYTKKILSAFEQISQVPRPSKKEEKIVAWLLNWAAENGLEARSDEALNVLIDVPATRGFEKLTNAGSARPYGHGLRKGQGIQPRF